MAAGQAGVVLRPRMPIVVGSAVLKDLAESGSRDPIAGALETTCSRVQTTTTETLKPRQLFSNLGSIRLVTAVGDIETRRALLPPLPNFSNLSKDVGNLETSTALLRRRYNYAGSELWAILKLSQSSFRWLAWCSADLE